MSDGKRCVEVLSGAHATILQLEGEIDIGSATDFKEALLQSIAGGARRIVIDATGVTFMDSSGLSVLIAGEQRLRPLDGSLAIACGERVRRLLRMTGLEGSFRLYPSRDEALRAALGYPGPGAVTLLPDAP